ncbi:MAG: adenosylcobinamide-GDP ribazoletransferase [Acidobacteria bacterium]|nr:adenosylcobinamide-GDP ribazoletransferase [Acidobacteriota bacterium]
MLSTERGWTDWRSKCRRLLRRGTLRAGQEQPWLLNGFLMAVEFLTILPVRARPGPLVAAAGYFPLVGALIGLASVAFWNLASPWMPVNLLALLLLLLWTVLNGGLHDDGLADCFDAFPAGRDREEILRILRDSRIGAFGALSLVFSLLLRWQSLVSIRADYLPGILIASQVLPRLGMIWLAFASGGASPGMGSSFADALRPRHYWGASAAAIAVLIPLAGWPALWAAAVCAAVIALLRPYFRHKLGGITGDCLGAANQLQEAAILMLGAIL